VALEDIGTVERLLVGGPRAGTEATHHCSFVVGQGVPVLIVLPREPFDVVVTCLDWALLGTLILMRQHVCFQVFEDLSTVGIGAASLLSGLFAAEVVLAAE
jgi:hypothetical protein